VIHGQRAAKHGTSLSAEQAKLGLRIDSFWGRRVSLNDLVLVQPRVQSARGQDGSNNLPAFKKGSSKEPLQQTLLDLHVRHVEIKDGWVLYNNCAPLLRWRAAICG